MAMKKTDLFKNLALTTAQRMKNAAKTPKPGAVEAAQKAKKELAKANPLLASLMGKTEANKETKKETKVTPKASTKTKSKTTTKTITKAKAK